MITRRPTKPPSEWPSWCYGPNDGDAKIVNSEEEIPIGWYCNIRPKELDISHLPVELLDHDELVSELIKRGISIDPTWGNAHMKRIIDSDISPAR